MFKVFMILVSALAYAEVNTTYPDHKLTPGATDPKITQANISKTICVDHYTAKVRNVSEQTKKKVLAGYLKAHPDWPKCGDVNHKATCEIDHLVSLELGGLNDAKNLWPEPYAGAFGARKKDVVETYLHRQICKGKITLGAAQKIITTDWVKEYKQIKKGK